MNNESDDERAARILGPANERLFSALNPETMFKLAPTPLHKTNAEINAMVDEDERMAKEFLARREQIVSELKKVDTTLAERARRAMLDAGWDP